MKKLQFSTYRPTKDEINRFVDIIANYHINKLVYQKIGDKYHVYCPHCKNVTVMPYKEFKIYRAIKLCKHCFEQYVQSTTKATGRFVDYAGIEKDGHIYGYQISFDYNFDKYTNIKCKQVYVRNINENKFYKLGIMFNMNGRLYRNVNADWCVRKLSSQPYHRYEDEFFINKPAKTRTKKEYLENIIEANKLKSNQLYMIKNNHVNRFMIYAINGFNLNYYSEVIECVKYINSQIHREMSSKYNVYTLRYLAKNNIRLSDYDDYMKECTFLGIDNKYPKNFNEAHAKYSKMYRELPDKDKRIKLDELIKKRLKELLKLSFEDKVYKIMPINCCDELKEIGEKLSNCIYGYKDKYAAGECDLFVIKDNKGIQCSIEVINKKVTQARIKHNKDPKLDMKKVINNWCNKNQLIYQGENYG